MSTKIAAKKTTRPVLQDVTNQTSVAKAPRAKKTKIVQETAPPAKSSEPEPANDAPATENVKTKKKRQVDLESVLADLSAIIAFNREQIEVARQDSNNKKTFIKAFRQNVNQLEQLKKDYIRLSKRKPKTNRKNVQSGFRMPRKFSKELYEFLGWNPNELFSIVDGNRALHQYIKANGLQDKKDKRHIIPDKKLETLLRTNKEYVENKKPLTYFLLMRFIKNHYIKNSAVKHDVK